MTLLCVNKEGIQGITHRTGSLWLIYHPAFFLLFGLRQSFPELPSLALTHPVVQSELGLAILLPQRLKSVDERVMSGGPQVDTVMIILCGGKN